MSSEEVKIKIEKIVVASWRGSPRAVWIKCLVCGNGETIHVDTTGENHSLFDPPRRWGLWKVFVPEHHVKKDWLGRNKAGSPICETSGKSFVINILPPKHYPKDWYEKDMSS